MDELACHDPLLFKFPKGVISKGKKVKFKIKVDLKCCPNVVEFMLKEDSDETYQIFQMKREFDEFTIETFFEKKGHYWYNFKLIYNDFAKFLNKTYDSYSAVSDEKGEDFLQLVTDEEYVCGDSLQGGVIYQIMVDRFCRCGEVVSRKPLTLRDDWGGKIKKNTENPVKLNQEVFGGNLEGLITKLDYLKSLNVTSIYLNPIFLANSHHKYDTASYTEIDPMFGSWETLKKLTSKAKKLGVRIIIDGVFNHTGSDSVYFNKQKTFSGEGAFNSKNSKFFKWYSFEHWPEKYECWWGIDTLPRVRSDCEEFQNFIAGEGGVIDKLFDAGVSGLRLDVVDELTDSFTKKISNRVKLHDSSAPIIGEVWEDASTKISYSKRRKYFVDNELNSVMNYPIRESILNFIKTKDAFSLNSTLRMLCCNYPKKVLDNLMNLLGTHDTGRIFSELLNISNGDEALATKFFKIATGILFTLPGTPAIFYGDEFGMENNDGSPRGCFDLKNAKGEKFEWIKTLTSLRKLDVFKDGEINILSFKGGKFIFERFSKSEQVVVLTNLKSDALEINFETEFTSLIQKKNLKRLTLGENQIEILYLKK